MCHLFFPGNAVDAQAFLRVLEDLKPRLGVERVLLMGDRGVVSQQTLDQLDCLRLDYIMGMPLRRFRYPRKCWPGPDATMRWLKTPGAGGVGGGSALHLVPQPPRRHNGTASVGKRLWPGCMSSCPKVGWSPCSRAQSTAGSFNQRGAIPISTWPG